MGQTFDFMSNFLWTVAFVICNLIGYLIGNGANAENDSLYEITHKIKSSRPNLIIFGSYWWENVVLSYKMTN